MRVIGSLLLVLAVLSMLPTGIAKADLEPFHDRGSYEFEETIWNECTGEDVLLTGTMVWTNRQVVSKSGPFQWGFQNRYQDVTGTGLTSGRQYRAIFGEHGYGSAVADPEFPYHYSAGSVSTMRLVAGGGVPDLVIRLRVHVTVTPDIVYHVDTRVEESYCK